MRKRGVFRYCVSIPKNTSWWCILYEEVTIMSIKDMSCGQLRLELEKANSHFEKTGEYCWLASVSYEMAQRKQRGEWE